MHRLISWFYSLAYKVEHHYLFKTSLTNWLWVLMVVPPLVALLGRLAWWTAILLSLLVGLMLIGIQWAKRQGYILFEPGPVEQSPKAAQPIEVDEQVAGWASGLFSVGNRERRLLDSTASISYVSTREHIVMARVKRTRFLLLTQSMKAETGLWYAFFMPQALVRIRTGTIWSGFRARPGLEIQYKPEERPEQEETFYLGFDDVETLRRVQADIEVDAPANVFRGE
jgi:hypothetical protein